MQLLISITIARKMKSAIEAILLHAGLENEELIPATDFASREISVTSLCDYPVHIDMRIPAIHDPGSKKLVRVDTAPSAAEHLGDDDDDSVLDDLSGHISPGGFRLWVLSLLEIGVPPTQILADLGLKIPKHSFGNDVLLEFLEQVVLELLEVKLPRKRIASCTSPEAFIYQLRRARKIIFLVGAGISVSAGIPDFRSKNGIYNRLQQYNLQKPTDMFNLDFFRSNPIPFYRFCPEIFPGPQFRPTVVHLFMRLLEKRGQLQRIYTQNIDCLEVQAQITQKYIINCHGSFHTFMCIDCGAKFPMELLRRTVVEEACLPLCRECFQSFRRSFFSDKAPADSSIAGPSLDGDSDQFKAVVRSALGSSITPRLEELLNNTSNSAMRTSFPFEKVSEGDDPCYLKIKLDDLCNSADQNAEERSAGLQIRGILKPQIIFFGEKLSSDLEEFIDDDSAVADMFIAIGSSLRVKPVSGILGKLPRTVPQVLINLESVGRPHNWDLELLGDCDIIMRYLLTELGWWDDFLSCAKELGLSIRRNDALIARQKVFNDVAAPWRYNVRPRIVEIAGYTPRSRQ